MSYDAWKLQSPDDEPDRSGPFCDACDNMGCPECCETEPVTLEDIMTDLDSEIDAALADEVAARDNLMTDLRESLLLERAKKMYALARADNDQTATVGLFMDVLRITRDEGIQTGHDQTVKYSEELEKAS